MQPHQISINDKKEIDHYLERENRSLAAYSFANIFIWRSHFNVTGTKINGKLCIFYEDTCGCFMILPPLGGVDIDTILQCFSLMDEKNNNSGISRIENIEESDLGVFKLSGKFRIQNKSVEHIVSTAEMARLSGDRFKHKRNLVNHFQKNNKFSLRDYRPADKKDVLSLYQKWMSAKSEKNVDQVCSWMMEDSCRSLEVFLSYFNDLDAKAKVIECTDKICAFTSGFPLSGDMFCINFEFADNSLKGINQFIFNEFSKELLAYKEINIMDDFAMPNIRATKLSYKPARQVVSYTVSMDKN